MMENKDYEPPEGLARTREEFFEELRTVHRVVAQDGMWTSFESWCDSDGAFNPALLAKDIVENNHVKTDNVSDTLYFYDEELGFYDRNGDAKVRALIDACLQLENRQHRTTEVTYLVHSKTLTTCEQSHKIAVINGLLDPKTQTLEPFSPEEFITLKIPIRYDQKADCPAIKKFLSEILEPDQIPIAQEMIGYCLLKELPLHTSFVLLGDGWNGKTTLLELLCKFLGEENSSHVTLQQLCEGKFELAQLHGKLANICDDLPSAALKVVSNYKTLTGNAIIEAQHKHKDPFSFRNTAKMFWSCNLLPAASEDTIAYYRRFIILNFNNYFIVGKNADIQLGKKLATPEELSGLLNFALEGLKRLLQNGKFTNSQSVEETRRQYIRTADSCLAFIEEATEIDNEPDAFTTDEALYSYYVTYCRSNKLQVRKKAKLTIAMQTHRPEARHTSGRVHGKVTWIWKHLKSVTPVTLVTPSDMNIESESSLLKKIDSVTPVTPVTKEAQIAEIERVCGHCQKWHTGCCSVPGDPNCVTPLNTFAKICPDYEEQEAT
jgi:putative DNA primase/helicase